MTICDKCKKETTRKTLVRVGDWVRDNPVYSEFFDLCEKCQNEFVSKIKICINDWMKS